jgi:hypothetical protein
MSDLVIRFTGLDANQGHVEIFTGLESASGIGRSLALIAHYAATGEVRRRFPFSDDVRFYLESTDEGSFKFKVGVVASSVAIGIGTNGIYDLGKLVLAKAIGEQPSQISRDVKSLDDTKSGDIEALVEAVEPALKKGHYAIGTSVQKIEIYEETTKKVVVTFDDQSKTYLNTNVPAGNDVQDASIPALNVNDRTGRAFLPELQRTVPFVVSRDARPGTMSALGGALRSYARKRPIYVRISFKKIESSDGRLKRLVIEGAESADE